MLPAEIATDTVTRLRGAKVVDGWDDAGWNWSAPASLSVSGCSVQPLQGDEDILTRDSVTSRWTLFAPPDADILSSDRVRFQGVDYEIDGSVQSWPDFGGLGHKVAVLKRIDG